jgi:hypothetical protein
MLLDDYVNGRDLFPEEWAADTGQKIPSKKKVLTESDFDFTEAGFANELIPILEGTPRTHENPVTQLPSLRRTFELLQFTTTDV